MAEEQLEIMENKMPLPDMTWSIKLILKFIQTPKIEVLLDFNSVHNMREVVFIEHNFSEDSSNSDSTL